MIFKGYGLREWLVGVVTIELLICDEISLPRTEYEVFSKLTYIM